MDDLLYYIEKDPHSKFNKFALVNLPHKLANSTQSQRFKGDEFVLTNVMRD